MAKRSLLLGFLISAFLTLSVFSQSNGQTITISVKDTNGAPVVGASVEITGRNFRSRTAVTDSQGEARFEGVAVGAGFKAGVNAAGFPTVYRDITSGAGTEVVLSPGSINESVTVTATRTQVATEDTAVPVSVIGRDALDRKPVNTIGDIFRDLPGTSTVNEGAFQVRPRIRGLDSNRILILVDGERLNNARTSTGQSGVEIGLVDVDQIETVEVVRGAGSVLYGTDALAGTVNIISRGVSRGPDDKFRFGAMLNGYFSSNEMGRRGTASVTGSNRWFAFRVAQSLERYQNYFSGEANGGVPAEGLGLGISPDGEVGNSQSHGGNTQITTRFFLNDRSDFRISGERRRGADIGSPLLTEGFGFNAYFPYSDRDKVSGRFEIRDLNDYLAAISSNFYWQRQNRNFTNVTGPVLPFFRGSFSETITDTTSIGFDLLSNWAFGSKNFVTMGVSFFEDENVDARLQRTVLPPFTPNVTTSVPRADFGSIAFFAQDEFTVNSRLKIIGGVRVERFRSSSTQTDGFALPATIRPFQLEDIGLADLATGLKVDETAVTGDVGAVVRVTDAVSLSARIGRSFRVANLFERFFTGSGSVGGFLVGNPNLEPESGINFDGGVRVRTSRFSGSVTYFNNLYRDFLSSTTALDARSCPVLIMTPTTVLDANECQVVSGNPTRVQQTINFGKVRIQGFEGELELPFRIGDAGFLTPNGSISYLLADNKESGQPFSVVPPLKTVLSIRWNDLGNRYYLEGQTRIVNTQDRFTTSFLASNGGPEPGYAVSDVRGGYFFRRERFNFSVNLGVTNVFNRYFNEQLILAPARGRSFTVGTTWEIR